MKTAATTDEQTPLKRLRSAVMARNYVSMGTRRLESVHEFYRYPARFTPAFAQAVIEAFSSPGDVVLDPFVGGGTTLVEARLCGRIGFGADISQLATFVSEAKTALPTTTDLDLLKKWSRVVDAELRLVGPTVRPPRWEAGGYFNGLAGADTWRIRDFMIRAVDCLPRETRLANLLARCALLRTAQWALDIRRHVPTLSEFRTALVQDVLRIAEASEQFSVDARHADANHPSDLPRTTIVHAAAANLKDDPSARKLPLASLVLTSPPYPGVYVLYHRWKLRGRREISTPYWLVGTPDGHGLSHYTMGARARLTLTHYYEQILNSFKDTITLAKPGATIVQLVGFSDLDSQLGPYLEAMHRIGLEELKFPELANGPDGRLWRTVPSRRWWVTATSKQGNGKHTAREVVLVHRVPQLTTPH